MSNPFAAIETALAASCCAALSNASARLPDGTICDGVFDARYDDPLGIANSQPRFTGPSARLASIVQDDQISLGDAAYSVRGLEPDGAGLIILTLRRA